MSRQLRRFEAEVLDVIADTLGEVLPWNASAGGLLDDYDAIAQRPGGRWPVLRRGTRAEIPPLILRRGTRAEIPPLTRQLVLRRDNHHCKRCASPAALQIDHVVPWSHLGPDRSDNLQTLCDICNSSRSNFLEAGLPRIVGVTAVCDPCLQIHDGSIGAKHNHSGMWAECPFCRTWGEDWEGDEHVPAYCGTCDWTSWVSQSVRIL